MRTFTAETLRLMTLFRDLTRVSATDCFDTGTQIVFTTSSEDITRAVGKQGYNVKRLHDAVNKDIKIITMSKTPEALIKSYVFPLMPKIVAITTDGVGNIEFKTSRERRILLNNNQQTLKNLKKVVARYYPDIKDIRVL